MEPFASAEAGRAGERERKRERDVSYDGTEHGRRWFKVKQFVSYWMCLQLDSQFNNSEL